MVERSDLLTHKFVKSYLLKRGLRNFIIFLCFMLPLCALYDYFFIESIVANPIKFGFMCFIFVFLAGCFSSCFVLNKDDYSIAEIVVVSKYRSDLQSAVTLDDNALSGNACISTQYGSTFIVDEFIFDKLQECQSYCVLYVKEDVGFFQYPYKYIIKILSLNDTGSLEE